MSHCALLLAASVFVAASASPPADVIVRLTRGTEPILNALPARSRQAVHDALSAHAADSQSAVVRLLKANQAEHRCFWIDNVCAVSRASGELVRALRQHRDVSSVTADEPVHLPPIVREVPILVGSEAAAAGGYGPLPAASVAAKPQGNIATLDVGPVWDAGETGTGVVVATIDSGVRWTHEALRANYRGFRGIEAPAANDTATHDYAYWTPKSTPLTPDTADFYGQCG